MDPKKSAILLCFLFLDFVFLLTIPSWFQRTTLHSMLIFNKKKAAIDAAVTDNSGGIY
jgi:hypothetical protein